MPPVFLWSPSPPQESKYPLRCFEWPFHKGFLTPNSLNEIFFLIYLFTLLFSFIAFRTSSSFPVLLDLIVFGWNPCLPLGHRNHCSPQCQPANAPWPMLPGIFWVFWICICNTVDGCMIKYLSVYPFILVLCVGVAHPSSSMLYLFYAIWDYRSSSFSTLTKL